MKSVFKNEMRVFGRTFYLPVLTALLFGALNYYLGWFVAQFLKLDGTREMNPVLPGNYNQDFGFLCFLGFVVLSYEFTVKIADAGLEECTQFGRGVRGRVLLAKGTILGALAVLLGLNVLAYDVYWHFKAGLPMLLLRQAVTATCLHYLLPLAVAILLGMVMATRLKRLAGYSALIALAFFLSPASDYFLARLAGALPVGRIKDFFTLFAQGMIWMPDPLYGTPGEPFRLFLNGFWIALLLIPICRMACRARPLRWGLTAALAAVCCLLFPTAFWRTGSTNKYGDNIPRDYAYSQIDSYYIFGNARREEQKADFAVSDCALELDIGLEMKAEATLTTTGGGEVRAFTLYHGYRVTGVRGADGTALPYRREGDYLWVTAGADNPITIAYKGSIPEFYSNHTATFLPGDFPFYPMAGLYPLFDTDQQSIASVQPEGETHFTLRVSAPYPLTVSLPGEQGVYEGRASSLSLAGGDLGETRDLGEGVSLFHPAVQKERGRVSRQTLQGAIDRCSAEMGVAPVSLPEQYTVFTAPATLPVMANTAVFADHVLVYQNLSPDAFALAYLCEYYGVPAEKRLVLQAVQGNLWPGGETPYPSLRVMRYMSNRAAMLTNLYAQAERRRGEEETMRRAYQYLFDNTDTRTPREFLEEISGFEEEVKADEAALSAL